MRSFPNQFPGLVLCAIPIATAVVVIMYPKMLTKFFIQEEPATLEELLEGETTATAVDGAGRKRKRRSGKAKGSLGKSSPRQIQPAMELSGRSCSY